MGAMRRQPSAGTLRNEFACIGLLPPLTVQAQYWLLSGSSGLEPLLPVRCADLHGSHSRKGSFICPSFGSGR